jgi:alpha-tubulin suppressor-like RCC1 family protein
MFDKMRTSMRAVALLAPLALSMAACTGDTGEGTARSAPFNSGRQLAISDQLHNNGTAGFVFLPPMVPRPAIFGDFLPDLEPIVRIDEVRADGTTVRTLATFTRDSGPSRERIRVHHQGRPCDPDDDDGDNDPNGYFYARWFTHNQHLSPSAVYRVRVFVQERVHPCTRNGWGRRCRHGEDNTAPMREVGFADVDVVRNHREVRCVDRAEFVPLINGQVLRIKFRIDRPVVDADGDGVYNWRDNCRTTANASQLDTNNDGEGDACECAGVTCAASDACHVAGTCNPANGLCPNPAAPDGTACSLANAAGACAAGACGVATCNAGFANCDGSAANGCEQTTNTLAHCGGCGVTCASGPHSTPTCATGACGLACESGWADADGDRANGCELDITTDANCGRPGNACVSGVGGLTTCVSGACSTMSCASGSGNCNSDIADGCEVNLTGDAANCGACGSACSVPNGAPACAAGACAVGSCNAGYRDCNTSVTDGCEIDAQTDVRNCGACGNACSLDNAAPVCAAGACAIGSCTLGFADVDGIAANGCEVNLATSPLHCGAVGNLCSATNGTAGCAAGRCTIASCDANFDNCDGNVPNGCERDLRSDVGHCGTCGNACPSGANSAASCAAGACVLTCATGFSNCDGSAASGCEIDSTSDGSNCGACGFVCTGGRTCIAGACSAAVCTAGLANCNGAEGDGCEVTLASDVNHCGACGNACSFANAAAECTAGTCGFSVCNTGFAERDGIIANGCEVNLNTDANNCGAVGNVCTAANGTPGCVGGVCVAVACNAGYDLVSGACVNRNDCSPNPCQNGGSCADGVGTYTCTCTGGYTGTNCQIAPTPPCGATAELASGGLPSHIIRNGQLWAFGLNSFGRLGTGDTTNRNTEVRIGTAANWAHVATGTNHGVAVRTDGSLWTWGRNNRGALGHGDTVDRHTPTRVGADNNWALVAAGIEFTVAIKTNGTMWAWGANTNGQLCMAGSVDRLVPTQVGTATTWSTAHRDVLSASFHGIMAIRTDGSLWGCGHNESGALGVGHTSLVTTMTREITNATNWARVQTNRLNSVGIKTNGTLWTTGNNVYGQLGRTCSAAPCNRFGQESTGATNWIRAVYGGFHLNALRSDGRIWSVGYDDGGVLWMGVIQSRPTWVQSPGTDFVDLGVTYYGSHALKLNGSRWGTGGNNDMYLGLGVTTTSVVSDGATGPRFDVDPLTCVAPVVPPVADSITGQTLYSIAGFGAFGAFRAAQTFTATTTAPLASVTMGFRPNGEPPPSVTLTLYATSGGVPVGAPLATATAPLSAFTTDTYLTFCFASSGITLNAGSMYAVVPSVPSGGLSVLGTLGADAYAGGTYVTSDDSGAMWSIFMPASNYDLGITVRTGTSCL